MRQFIIKILKKLLLAVDKKISFSYNENIASASQDEKINIDYELASINNIKEIHKEWMKQKINFNLTDFYNLYGEWVLRDMYSIINEYYISELARHIYEWNNEELVKLKYLQIILIDFKNMLNDNN